MSENISNNLLLEVSEFISSRMGLHFPDARIHDMERGLHRAASDFGFAGTEEFIKWLLSAQLTKQHIETLASHLTVGETYFFRETESFNTLETDIIPELIRSRQGDRRLRIWTAGCSTGEEPYSIAILLLRLIPDLKNWNVTILATDINPIALRKASEGVFTEWSFRGTTESFKERYFKTLRKGHYEILPHIKKMIAFSYLNLAEDPYPSLLNNTNAMDLVLCRNVLMYFSQDQADRAVQGFYNSLVDDGWLVLGPTDGVKPQPSMFEHGGFPGTTLYRKIKSGEKRDAGIRLLHENVIPVEFKPESIVIHSGFPIKQFGNDKHEIAQEDNGKLSSPQPSPDRSNEALRLFEQGRYAEATDKLREMHEGDQADPGLTALLAKSIANQGKLDEAAAWCEKAIISDMVNPAYHYLYATIRIEQGNTEEAVKSLKKALYLDHDFVLAYFMLGNIMHAQGKESASKKYLQNASSILARHRPEEIIPESEGVTAGRLLEIIGLNLVSEP